MTLNDVYAVIQQRKTDMPKGSYITSLFEQGTDRIIQKVGEEAVETVIAAKNKDRVVEESADLVFHLLVLLASQNITVEDLLKELEKRKK